MYYIWWLTSKGFMDLPGCPPMIEALDIDFDQATPCPEPFPKVEYTIPKKTRGAYADVISMAGARGEIVSRKVKTILEDLKVAGLQFIPILFRDERDQSTNDGYFIMNVLNQGRCFDLEHSKVEMDDLDPGTVMSIEELVLDEKALEGFIKANQWIIRPAEITELVMVDEKIKDALESQGVTGVQFVHPENFHL